MFDGGVLVAAHSGVRKWTRFGTRDLSKAPRTLAIMRPEPGSLGRRDWDSSGAADDGTSLGAGPRHFIGTPETVSSKLAGSAIVRSLPALLIYLVLSVWVWKRIASHITTRTLDGGLGDAGLILWWLRWAPFALTHWHDPLYTHYLNAPIGASAMWNVSMLSLGVIFTPITVLVGVVATFNLLCILGPALSAWTCSLWLRRHAGALPATVGGLLFGFSPFVVAQGEFAHLMLTWLAVVPVIAMLAEDVLWRSPRPWWPSGPLLGLVVAVQLFISSEVLVMTLIAAFVGVFVLVAAHFRVALS